ncbi:hypothetical protein E4T47_07497 [Aureobasidium subglaciale]|nr:hypothetical protein E4T47_07497 [Aureobasidium subglaciale]
MDGFSFPPPPPPPPKAASSSQPEASNQYNSRGGRGGRGGGGGRGGRGSFRGRGGAPQRSGGNFQHQNTIHTASGQNTGNYQPNYGNQQQHQGPSQFQNNQHYQAPQPQQYQIPQQYQALPGSYVNPAFGGMQAQAYAQPQASQYGQQKSYATGQNSQPLYGTPGESNYPPAEKRTRDQAFGSSNRGNPVKRSQSASKAQVAPAVPSFGAPILPQKPPPSLASGGVLKQRPSTGLGLIPQEYESPDNSDENEDEDVDEENVDEEAALSALQDGPLSFEFNGELSTLGSAADIAEWIEERRKRWPSKRRVEEKELEVQSRMEERRRIEQETRAAIASASGGEYQPVVREDRQQRQMRKPATERHARQAEVSTLEDTQKELAIQMQKVEELQKRLTEREGAHDSTMTEAAGQAMDNTQQPQQEALTTNTIIDQTSSNLPEQGAHAELASPAAEQHLYESDSDAPPEETTSKLSHPIRVPPPTANIKALPKQQQPETRYCVSFVNQGRCKFGNKCRFKHESGSGLEKGKRKTLYQRLVEQEVDEENRLALQAIKYLGGVGFFSKHAAST